MGTSQPRSRTVFTFVAVASAYALAAQVAYDWFGAGVFPVFFPAAGVTVAALVLSPRPAWPAVLAGAGTAEVVVDLAHGSDLAPALGWAVANLTEATAGAVLLLYACRGRPVDLSRRGDLVAFLALPVGLSPALGGLLGAANAELLGTGAEWPEYVLRWWIGDGLGVLVVGGAALAVARCGVDRIRERWLEAVAVAAAATLATAFAFSAEDVHWGYVPFVIMPWVAFRLGTPAVAIVGALVAVVAAQEVALAPSLWNEVDVSPRTGVLYVQVAIATMTATSLLLAAEAGERDDAVRERARADEERRYEHAVAVSLQRALLPERLVGNPHVALSALYRASDERLEVGGDWYETLALPGGRLGVAVGDVVGHGLEAAVAMGQLRTAVAALGRDCGSPVELLEQLDEFAAKSSAMHYSSACFASLDPATGVVDYASAGHPPILLVDPRTGSRFLEGGLSWPLCAVHGKRAPHGSARLEPGATLVLYSDGLVERRGEPIDIGLERLAAAANRSQALEPEALCHALVAELIDGRRVEDDVVVVAVRLLAVPVRPDAAFEGAGEQPVLELNLPNSLEAPTAARRALSSLNGSLHLVSAGRLRDIQLLVTELVANAVRHGAQREDTVGVVVRANEQAMRVEVTDRGGGFDPARLPGPSTDAGGGWGLEIVTALAHRWGVERDADTTVWFEVDRPQAEDPLPR
ncbi:MAG TPA: SpoIIE family protein phosphatase [Solirubrobacteraceae bacterium]|nr:SpoIIE family protein phosphatase [Solirubrobacteraceae bacterium]